jgi:hypothetical protein
MLAETIRELERTDRERAGYACTSRRRSFLSLPVTFKFNLPAVYYSHESALSKGTYDDSTTSVSVLDLLCTISLHQRDLDTLCLQSSHILLLWRGYESQKYWY